MRGDTLSEYILLARGFALASSDGAEITLLQVQEGTQPLLPLLEQLNAMNKDQHVNPAPGNGAFNQVTERY